MAKLYLDSNIVIRLVEEETPAWDALCARVADLSAPDGLFVVSDLVYMECLVKPLALGDAACPATPIPPLPHLRVAA